MQIDPKKKNIPSKQTLIMSLRKQVSDLKSQWMRLEGDRIQLAVRHTDLMCYCNSISATYAAALQQRNETIQQLLKDAGMDDLVSSEINSRSVRDLREENNLLEKDKSEQTELW